MKLWDQLSLALCDVKTFVQVCKYQLEDIGENVRNLYSVLALKPKPTADSRCAILLTCRETGTTVVVDRFDLLEGQNYTAITSLRGICVPGTSTYLPGRYDWEVIGPPDVVVEVRQGNIMLGSDFGMRRGSLRSMLPGSQIRFCCSRGIGLASDITFFMADKVVQDILQTGQQPAEAVHCPGA